MRRGFLFRLWVLIAACVFASACTVQDTFTPAPPITETPRSIDWITAYFTDPTSPTASTNQGGFDEVLVADIDQARLSVDMAIYDFNLWSLRDALILAHQRGVEVRMVTDSDNMDEPEIQELKDDGIQVLGDRRQGLMHDKFVIIDRSIVWIGSTNLTAGSVYQNDNNMLRIRSQELADDYTTEFEEMFVDDQFGPGSPANTPHPQVTVNGTRLEVYFSPEDGVLVHLMELVRGAQESIDFLAYSFTTDKLADAMITRSKKGVTVQGVFDEDQYYSNAGTEFDTFKKAGLDVRLDGNPRLMHHKVIIIDGKIVITGSYNFTASAEERNDENVLIIYSPQVAAQYLTEFQRVFDMAQK